MVYLAKPFNKALFLFYLAFTLPKIVNGAEILTCFDYQIHKAATSITKKQMHRMLSDASYPENQHISREEKVSRVIASINDSHQGLEKISDQKLAELIVKVSECSGNDFTVFAGLLKKESDYCLNRLNTSSVDSTASGCGQFTIWPIREFKNQLLLPRRKQNGDPEAKMGIEHLLSRCLSPKENRDFRELFSKDSKTIKTFLQQGVNFKLDLVASAIFLKFYYGKVGFYYNPHSKAPGALSMYGEGARYAGLVNKFSTRIQNLCVDETDYIKSIEQASCELSSDPKACFLSLPTYEI